MALPYGTKAAQILHNTIHLFAGFFDIGRFPRFAFIRDEVSQCIFAKVVVGNLLTLLCTRSMPAPNSQK
jgi:hypothetical protein